MIHSILSPRYRGHKPAYRRLTLGLIALIAGIALAALLRSPASAQTPRPQAGGDTTIYSRTSRAFEQPAPNLDASWAERHAAGDLAFEAAFVTAPARVNPGLGPLFNGTGCAGCHIKNGRGLLEKGQRVLRVSQLQPSHSTASDAAATLEPYAPEAESPGGNAVSVPGIGTQLQEQGVYGHAPEAVVQITWTEQSGTYEDGTTYSLRSPQIQLLRLDGAPLAEDIAISSRIPQPVFGAGLLEAVPEADVVQRADPSDRDGDGVSGRPNRVWNVVEQRPTLGRFGWKANTPTLLQQSAAAYVNDMGVTNPLFPDADGQMDIDMDTLEAAETYVQTIAVPARTLMDDPQAQRGERLFSTANCTACHVAELRTGAHKIPALANQTIHPYTDLLLHDLGPGLADGRPDFEATGQEWRTPPLWGVGLTQTVLPFSGFLHDGRARTLEEAILWHGGEAELAKETFRAMATDDRAALIRFLRSL
ncbi:c-type cytochrome [Nodosilinea sp. LEGE 07088]|uniref:di-heme oxidoreductase family protein n=1 Tax=Nodosilinea sp. LEGE 07088 TaxID=2777968 RepID=UPI0018812082|nr:di-heme oxidoredictase family protein [Nodosilinea sp. LEGE 07088]MBE9137829.1 c-type cytochrome [Nodosilinea sp. LEGE 07088]